MTGTPFNIAFKLHTLGFTVIPSGGGEKGKKPLVNWKEFQRQQPTEDELESWQQDLSPQLWGIVTGALSGLVVVDADTPEARKELEGLLGTPHVNTPGGGGHYYFKHPGRPVKTIAGLLPGVDMRGDGGFVNIVGASRDGAYQIVTLPTPDNLHPWESLPERIQGALNGGKPAAQARKAEGAPIPKGQRNARLTSLAGTMRRRGMPQNAIKTALLEVNATQCQPPLPEGEVLAIAKSVSRYEPQPPRAKASASPFLRLIKSRTMSMAALIFIMPRSSFSSPSPSM